MNDLISRSALLEEVTRSFDAFIHGAYFRAACDAIRAKSAVIRMLNDAPAVHEVKHMTERQKQLLEIMERCVLNGEFCDNCPNNSEDYEGCHATHKEFMDMVRASWEGENKTNEGETTNYTGECQRTAQH